MGKLTASKIPVMEMPVSDVWGIGYNSMRKLKAVGIQNAFQLKTLDRRWARKLLTVTGAKDRRGIKRNGLSAFGTNSATEEIYRLLALIRLLGRVDQ